MKFDLPPYSTESTCKKCCFGPSGIKSEHIDSKHWMDLDGKSSLLWEEHIRRTCFNCGYDWAEACADAPPPEETTDA